MVLALALVATSARAVSVGTTDGWSLTVGGFVNGFVVSESGDVSPHPDLYGRTEKDSTIRVRTGFLPGLIGVTATAPEVEGMKVGGRVGLYPQINGAPGGRTTINGANLDVRELNFTVDGKFGQLLMGRALALYQGKNVLTDMSLFGVGHPSPIAFGNGPTLGHIGSGYLYPSFVSQLRYTTPELGGGFKLAVAAVDPAAPPTADPATSVVLGTPTLEGELAWAGKSDALKYAAWLSGVYQSSKVAGTSVTSQGGAAGASLGFSGLEVVVSGFAGSGLGTDGVINSGNALDAVNKPRNSNALFGQVTYTIGKAKLGVNYGQLKLEKTNDDKATPNPGLLDGRSALTGGVYYDVTTALKLVAEYTHLEIKFEDASKAKSDTVAVGGFVFF